MENDREKCPRILETFSNGSPDCCCRRRGHQGKCYTLFHLKARELLQEVLQLSKVPVVKATDMESEVLKMDFWVYSPEENSSARPAFFLFITNFTGTKFLSPRRAELFSSGEYTQKSIFKTSLSISVAFTTGTLES